MALAAPRKAIRNGKTPISSRGGATRKSIAKYRRSNRCTGFLFANVTLNYSRSCMGNVRAICVATYYMYVWHRDQMPSLIQFIASRCESAPSPEAEKGAPSPVPEMSRIHRLLPLLRGQFCFALLRFEAATSSRGAPRKRICPLLVRLVLLEIGLQWTHERTNSGTHAEIV